MATLILRDTHIALQDEIKASDKLRTETALKIQEAASHGDLKENYEYKAAKEAMNMITYKKQLLQSHAPFKIIEYNEIEINEVQFGNKIKVLEEGKDEPDEYYLLGPIEFELDLYPMIITYNSPFAQAIAGKKINDSFTLEIRGNDTKFTVVEIERISSK